MKTWTQFTRIALVSGLLFVGSACGQPLVQFGGDSGGPGEDTGGDTASADTARDTAVDTGTPDTATDTAVDTGRDTGADADTTGGDTEPPFVVTTIPRDGEAGFPVFQALNVRFSEQMDPSTLDDSTFQVSTSGGTAVSGTVTVSGAEARFEPDSDLDAGVSYDATITSDAADLAGNALEADYQWSFTTADSDAPVVVATNPPALATGVAQEPSISVKFSQQMDGTTIDATSFTLTKNGNSVSGTVSSVGDEATFVPDSPLDLDSDYVATVTTDIEGESGKSLVQDFSWSFTTTDDPGPPKVIGTRPFDLQTGVTPHRNIRVFFSEPMDPATVDSSTFTLTQNGNPVSGTARLRGNQTSATFVPDSELDPNTTFQATVKSSVADTQGDTLPNDYVWTFATGDTVRPVLVRVSPSDGATDVGVDTTIVTRFSKKMDASTFDTNSFSLTNDGTGTPVSGTVTLLNAKRAEFVPDSDLDTGTTYNVRVTTDVEDRGGNQLLTDNDWSFTTASP